MEEDGNSAHQFSKRSNSVQADSEERDEIDLQLQLIDDKLKDANEERAKKKDNFPNDKMKVDVYDLNPNSEAIKSHSILPSDYV